jgi:hypothetical protein
VNFSKGFFGDGGVMKKKLFFKDPRIISKKEKRRKNCLRQKNLF